MKPDQAAAAERLKTVVIQIGNSDNKLTQNQWAHYIAGMDLLIKQHCYRVHFRGGSDWDAPWQNACWIAEVDSDMLPALLAAVKMERNNANQDSAAVLIGDTEFI